MHLHSSEENLVLKYVVFFYFLVRYLVVAEMCNSCGNLGMCSIIIDS